MSQPGTSPRYVLKTPEGPMYFYRYVGFDAPEHSGEEDIRDAPQPATTTSACADAGTSSSTCACEDAPSRTPARRSLLSVLLERSRAASCCASDCGTSDLTSCSESDSDDDCDVSACGDHSLLEECSDADEDLHDDDASSVSSRTSSTSSQPIPIPGSGSRNSNFGYLY